MATTPPKTNAAAAKHAGATGHAIAIMGIMTAHRNAGQPRVSPEFQPEPTTDESATHAEG